MPTDPADERITQYLIVTGQLLDRGTNLMSAMEQVRKPGLSAFDMPALIDAYENITSAVVSTIKLDVALRQARSEGRRPRLKPGIIAAICRRLDAAASLLPHAPKPPRHAESAALCARVQRLIPAPAKPGAAILPFVRPAR